MLKNHCDFCGEVEEGIYYLLTLTKRNQSSGMVHCVCNECADVVTVETLAQREQEIRDGLV